MSSDDDVKKIAKFLENGGTMLANHCEECGAPLFRFRGEIICPLCSEIETETKQMTKIEKSPAVTSKNISKKENALQKHSTNLEKTQNRQTMRGTSTENYDDYTIEATVYSNEKEKLRELILFKLNAVAEEMQNENDSRHIFEYLEIIEKGLDLIERLD